MFLERCSGILLHPTSLPGRYGVGTFDQEAFDWVDFLDRTQQTIWQILPLGPTSFGDSPYQSFSTFAGSPYLIGLDTLVSEGLMSSAQLNEALQSADYLNNPEKVDYGSLYKWKMPLLRQAAASFDHTANTALAQEYQTFCKQHAAWLDDYALFMAIKDSQNDKAWSEWPEELRTRKTKALKQAAAKLAEPIKAYKFMQWVFDRQWNKLRTYANEKNIKILGDLPIFVAMDSADAWTHADLFCFDKDIKPTCVAGVPPDGFSADGQLWGNPLYNWKKMKKDGYSWWISRLKSALARHDIVRVDHFRGFAGYWEVDATAETAVKGKWVKGPGHDLFKALTKELGDNLPIVAEDLGVITPDVVELRDTYNLPGMKILQFAFGDNAQNPFLPHNYPENCIAYTGTHDNDTTRGWYEESSQEKDRDRFRRYFSTDGWDMAWTMIRGIEASVAQAAIAPLQDLLDLGSSARMNYPGKKEGNWQWRFRADQLQPWVGERLLDLTTTYGRTREKLTNKEEAQKAATEEAAYFKSINA